MMQYINSDITNSYKIFTQNQIDLYYYKLKAFTNKDKDIKESHILKTKEKVK